MAAGTHPGRDPYGGCLTLARRAAICASVEPVWLLPEPRCAGAGLLWA